MLCKPEVIMYLICTSSVLSSTAPVSLRVCIIFQCTQNILMLQCGQQQYKDLCIYLEIDCGHRSFNEDVPILYYIFLIRQCTSFETV